LQSRSKARVERILAVAHDCIEEGGIDALRTGDIAKRAGISIGSLYQYFPDRAAIIRALAERYNAEGLRCTAEELARAQSIRGLPEALSRIVAGFLAMYRAEPVMRDIWSATQVDRELQAVDSADLDAHVALFDSAFRRIGPHREKQARLRLARLVAHLIASTARLAITLDTNKGDALLAEFRELVLEGVPARLLAVQD
jgi:AcrR family transcriptional regulator